LDGVDFQFCFHSFRFLFDLNGFFHVPSPPPRPSHFGVFPFPLLCYRGNQSSCLSAARSHRYGQCRRLWFSVYSAVGFSLRFEVCLHPLFSCAFDLKLGVGVKSHGGPHLKCLNTLPRQRPSCFFWCGSVRRTPLLLVPSPSSSHSPRGVSYLRFFHGCHGAWELPVPRTSCFSHNARPLDSSTLSFFV